MGTTSGLSSREGSLPPWASETWLLFSQRLFSGPLRLPICRPSECLPALNGAWSSPTGRAGQETWTS